MGGNKESLTLVIFSSKNMKIEHKTVFFIIGIKALLYLGKGYIIERIKMSFNVKKLFYFFLDKPTEYRCRLLK